MNTTANVVAEMPIDVPAKTVAAKPMWETLRWSVQRELWENRSIYIAPAAIAGFILLATFISLLRHPEPLAFLAGMSAEDLRNATAVPFSVTSMLVLLTSMLVAFFYCLDAMYSERRERSILFWKSMPVSDEITVAAKFCVPMVVVPAVTFVVIVVMHFLMLVLGSVVMLIHGLNAGILWKNVPLVQLETVLAYGLIVMSIWFATVYGWVLLVSSWAKRMPLLWAILPWIVAGIVEKIAFGTMYVHQMVKSRITGFVEAAFTRDVAQRSGDAQHVIGFMPVSSIAPGHLLMTPGFWIGLVFAAGFFFAVVRMRRYREPI